MKRWPILLVALSINGTQAAGRCEAPEHRAFDFWLGRWDVLSDGEIVAESLIERAPDACAILEHYKQKDGYTGTSVNFYDATLHRWRQTWVDAAGTVGEFHAEAGMNVMAFTGETHRVSGERILRRMTISLEADGTVRQHSLASTDGGATWKPHYDFRYRRR